MRLCNNICDVLVVGGGPAGLAAAIALRQRGAEVTVADALRPPIDKPCGEGLMPDSRRELARLGVDPGPGHGAAFRGILYADQRAEVSAEFPRGVGLGVRRTVLQRLLLERAAALGVRFQWGSPVTVRKGLPVTVGGERVGCQWLVGADGMASQARAWAGLEAAKVRSRRFGFRAHFRRAPWSEFVEIHWGAKGEAYVTPVGADEICVAAMSRTPTGRLDEIVEHLPALRERLAGAERTTAERGSVTLTRRLRRVTRGNVALVGDASGSVDAITGEGLGLSFRQALLLAESLEAGGCARYEAGHAALAALPRRMAELLLLMDRFPALQRRAMGALTTRPELFRGLLAVHVGEQPLPRYLLRHGATMGALMLAAREGTPEDLGSGVTAPAEAGGTRVGVVPRGS
ncbi:MAG TPA: FAD-dependent monooxygenase [Acidobacteriaceae bacterium]|nr:FAD-dependent monooxygenase [Acidobacteriaceae bacterium]